MLFDSYITFIYIALFIIIYNAVRYITPQPLVRNIVLALGNLFMLLTLVKEHTIIVIAIVSLVVFTAGIFLQKRHVKQLLAFMLVLIITLFSIRNYSFVQDIISKTFLAFVNAPILSVQKLGLSYILFRYIHWLIESYRGHIYKPDFFSFLNYIFFFPSILAGPIDTYNNFRYWLANHHPKYQRSLSLAGISRIAIGAIKTLGIVPLVQAYAVDYRTLMPAHSPLVAITLSLLAYSAYIYFDFSGYSDIAIGTAYLVGIRTPENFNNPYLSANLSEFWKRWHITFSTFLMLYVFKPFTALFNRFIKPGHRLAITVTCYILTFLICGLWHGSTLNFVYWGLWHGLGLTANKIWTVQFKPALAFSQTSLYKAFSVALTFGFVTIGWAFFCYSTAQLHTLFNLLK